MPLLRPGFSLHAKNGFVLSRCLHTTLPPCAQWPKLLDNQAGIPGNSRRLRLVTRALESVRHEFSPPKRYIPRDEFLRIALHTGTHRHPVCASGTYSGLRCFHIVDRFEDPDIPGDILQRDGQDVIGGAVIGMPIECERHKYRIDILLAENTESTSSAACGTSSARQW